MISQFNSATMRTAMSNTLSEPKETKNTQTQANAKLTSENRVEQLKASINSGEYKVDLQALSEKMAQELL
jgi:anti-sigma28 factor (negative regulator of flagellin synthesis)